MDLTRTKLYQMIKDRKGSIPDLWKACHDYINSKKNINLTDNATGQTFLHVLAGTGGKLCTPEGVSIIYLMAGSGMMLDVRDREGETCLHKAVRVEGSYRVVVALIRCGVDPLIANDRGQTAEDVLNVEQPPNWSHTLHWLDKFQPGLYHALSQEPVDELLVERLLNGWCRTILTRDDGNLVELSRVLPMTDNLRKVVDKATPTNEFVLTMLAGTQYERNGHPGNIQDVVDVNTHDMSYETQHHVQVPRPLIAAVWESNLERSIDTLMDLGVNTSTLFSKTGAKSDAEPLFFNLLRLEHQPSDAIIFKVLINSDMTSRDPSGQTILFKAIEDNRTEQFIAAVFLYGAKIETRDQKGRTARDWAEFLGKTRYFNVIDEQIVTMAKNYDIDGLRSLVLQGYDHIVDVTDHRGMNLLNVIQQEQPSPNRNHILDLIEKIPSIQNHLTLMFRSTDTGGTDELRKLTSRKFATAQDKCGRSILHKAILNKKKEMIKFIVQSYPHIINLQDNMGRTALHYAYLVTEGLTLVNYLKYMGIDSDITDWSGRRADTYHIDQCGKDEYLRLQRSMNSFSMDVYLAETNFEQSLLKAIKRGNVVGVEQLVHGLTDKGDINRYANVLFQCVDTGRQDIAVYLIRQGMRTDIYKQYDDCSPRSSACSTYMCNHTLTSLYTRAKKMKCRAILGTIDARSDSKTLLEVDGRPMVKGPSTMDQFSLLGLL